ncbi:MAG: hypothetical protein H7833_06405 [Magnetococcus sp. DMHC-1]
MIEINLAIDEEGMAVPFSGVENVESYFSDLTMLLKKAKQDKCRLWIKSTALYGINLINNDMVDNLSSVIINQIVFYELIYGKNHLLEHDTKMLLMVQIEQCKDIDCEVDKPAPTTADQVRVWKDNGQAAACIVLRSGKTRTPPAIYDEKSLLEFYREVPAMVNCTETEYIAHAAISFPRLHFKKGIDTEFRRFQEPYPSIRNKISQALAVLNDQLEDIRGACGQEWAKIARMLTIKIGFETSPESPNTHGNRVAMRERHAEFSGHDVCCDWHVKFQPTTDRMHFHFGKPEIANGRILICHFVDHFTT